jgi:hypothetical protein
MAENVHHSSKYIKIFQFQLSVWENDTLLCQFNMVEEIRDFTVADKLMYTVRDRDVCINELLPGRYVYHSLQQRFSNFQQSRTTS